MRQSEQLLWLGFAVLVVLVWIANAVIGRWGERMVAKLPAGDQPMLRTRLRLLRRVAVAVTDLCRIHDRAADRRAYGRTLLRRYWHPPRCSDW